MISFEEFLQYLVARTNASSSFGAQLEKLYFGEQTYSTDPYQTLASMEASLIHNAPVYRFLQDISEVGQFDPKERYPKLNKFQRKTGNIYKQGAVAVYVLRLYQEWQTKSKERGFAEIYKFINKHNKKKGDDLRMEFALDHMKSARKDATELYADCLLAVADYLEKWNENEKSVRKSKRSRFTAAKNRRKTDSQS